MAERNGATLKLQEENFALKLRVKELTDERSNLVAAPAATAAVGEAELAAARREGDEKLALARDIIQRLKSELEQSKDKADAALAERDTLHTELEEARKEVARLRETVSAAATKPGANGRDEAAWERLRLENARLNNRLKMAESAPAASMDLARAREDMRKELLADLQQQQQQRTPAVDDTARLKADLAQARQRIAAAEADASTWRAKYERVARATPQGPSPAQLHAVERALQAASDRLEALELDHHLKTTTLRRQCDDLEQRNRELVSQVRELSMGDRRHSSIGASPATGTPKRASGASSPLARETPAHLDSLHRHAVRRLDLVDSELASATERLSKAAM